MTDWESIRRKYQRMSGKDQPFRVLIFPGALRMFHLDAVDAGILHLIAAHTNNYDFCALNKGVIAPLVGVKPVTISHCLARLQDAGLIERVYPSERELVEHTKKGGHTGNTKKKEGNPTYYRTTGYWNACVARKRQAAKQPKAK